MKGYKQALWEEMKKLAKDPKVIFIGQQVGAEDFYGTLKDIPIEKRIEMPVTEELQTGITIGMSLEGFLPISIYQRMDFLPRACDQIVNHLDLIDKLSEGRFKPKVIIRTTIGSKAPLDTGLQHSKDLSEGFQKLVSFPVIKALSIQDIHSAYDYARDIKGPIMIIEDQNLYGE